jgi:hypothetical protein
MGLLSVAAVAVIAATSLILWLLGNRFARRHVELHGSLPRATWMFRRSDDPQLEDWRRFALALLPLDVAAVVVYVVQS